MLFILFYFDIGNACGVAVKLVGLVHQIKMPVLGDDIILAYFEVVDVVDKRRFADSFQISTVNRQLLGLDILLQLLGVQLFHEAGVGNTLAGILVINNAMGIVHTMCSLIIIVPGVEGEADKLVIFVNHLIIAADSTHIRMAQILTRFADHFGYRGSCAVRPADFPA